MGNYWTSKKPIYGLRHFVLVNKERELDQIVLLLVSVIDVEINLKINQEEFLNSNNWEKGWVNLPKVDSITDEYTLYKSSNKGKEGVSKIFINQDSLFNIS